MSEAVELKEACHHTDSDQGCDKILDNSSSDNQEKENNDNLLNLENDSNVDEELRDSYIMYTENNDFGISDQNHTDTDVDENNHPSDKVTADLSSILQKLEQLEKEIEDLRQTVPSKDLVEESKLHIKSLETDKHHQDKHVDIGSEHKGQRLKEEQKKTIKLESDHRSSNWRIAMQTGIVSSMITFLLGASIMYYRESSVQMINTTVEILTAELNLSVKTLQADLEKCKANYTQQEDKLLHLKRNIALMNGAIEYDGESISYYAHATKVLDSVMQSLNGLKETLKQTEAHAPKVLDSVMQSLNGLKETLKQTEDINMIKQSRVAFSASLTQVTTLSNSQTVIFDEVDTNYGAAYNKDNGHFTAPRNGLYYFSCSFLGTAKSIVYLMMTKNGEGITKGLAQVVPYGTGTMETVISLKHGDIVSVIHFPNLSSQTLHGDNWARFVGFSL